MSKFVYVMSARVRGQNDFSFSAVFATREDATGWTRYLNMAQVDPPIDEQSDEVWQMKNGTQFKISPEPLLTWPI